jgi:hypothetical protein
LAIEEGAACFGSPGGTFYSLRKIVVLMVLTPMAGCVHVEEALCIPDIGVLGFFSFFFFFFQEERVPAQMESEAAAVPADKSAQEYAALLERSKGRDFSEFEQLHILDITGHDPLGRPIVVFVASRLPAKSLNMDDFLLFIIQKLDQVVKNDYVLVYVGSEVSAQNRPSVAWLRKAYGLFNRNYKKQIQKLYLIRPTTFTRVALKFFKLVVSEKFWRKLVTIDDISQLHLFVSPEQLKLPEACYSVQLRKGQKLVLFGVSLERALAENPHPSGCPAFLVDLFSFLGREAVLQTEGLFRVSGSEVVSKNKG